MLMAWLTNCKKPIKWKIEVYSCFEFQALLKPLLQERGAKYSIGAFGLAFSEHNVDHRALSLKAYFH